MADPTVDELLKVGFKIGAEMALDMLEPGLDWPDDIDGQRAIIRRLAGMATTTILYEWQVWAFKKLNEIVAAEYGEKEQPVPPEVAAWCFGVVSGRVKQPRRPRGRPAAEGNPLHELRNRSIVALVSWLREQGHVKTNAEAKQKVADAAGLSYEYVEDILEKSWK